MNRRQIRVGIADDQALVRAGFRMLVDSQDDMVVVGEAGSGDEALELFGGDVADVVLMDVRMPGLDGLAATRALVGASSARIVVLTTFDLDEYVAEAVRAGASGFLLKDAPPEEMLSAIRRVAEGDAVLAPSATRRLLDRLAPSLTAPADSAPLEGLTAREREVLVLVAQGLTNADICDRLVLAGPTVKTHVGHILAKLGARDRVHAVVIAYETGLVRPGSVD